MTIPGRLFLAFLLVVAPFSVLQAAAPRTVTWDDLAPPLEDLQQRFRELTDDQLAELNEVYDLRQYLRESAEPGEESEGVKKQIAVLEKSLLDQDIDLEGWLAKVDAAIKEYRLRQAQPIASLDGQEIRLPGYVLPLEFNGTAVSEFFLVPYVGACIHTPAPDPNQIVLVKLNQSYKPDGLYDAVWITGTMKVTKSAHKLTYRDGVGSVTSTYQLDGTSITPYK